MGAAEMGAEEAAGEAAGAAAGAAAEVEAMRAARGTVWQESSHKRPLKYINTQGGAKCEGSKLLGFFEFADQRSCCLAVRAQRAPPLSATPSGRACVSLVQAAHTHTPSVGALSHPGPALPNTHVALSDAPSR